MPLRPSRQHVSLSRMRHPYPGSIERMKALGRRGCLTSFGDFNSCGTEVFSLKAQYVLSVFIIALGLFAGCDRHTTRIVTASDVIGTWRMTPDSLSLLRHDGFAVKSGQTYTITFAADGSLVFKSVQPEGPSGVYRDANGDWTLQHNVPIDNETKRTNCLNLNLSGFFFNMSFSHEDGKLKMWTYYGDPDEGKYLIYERQ